MDRQILSLSWGVHCLQIETAREMQAAVMEHFSDSQIVIKAAAVADFRPLENKTEKIKKNKHELSLSLTRNSDILLELGKQNKHKLWWDLPRKLSNP